MRIRLLPVAFAFLFFAVAPSAHAQLFQQAGLRAGAVSSSVTGSGEIADDRHLGFGVLLFAEWLDIGPLSLITEAGYMQRGFTQDRGVCLYRAQASTCYSHTSTTYLHYLSMATLAKLQYTRGPSAPYVLLGPRLEIQINRGREFTYARMAEQIIWHGTVGAGVELNRLLGLPLFTEIRYSFALENALAEENRQSALDPAGYNRSVEVMLGITF